MNQNWRDMVADLSGSLAPPARSSTQAAKFHVEQVSLSKLSAVLASFSFRLGRIEDIIHDLESIRKSSPRLANVSWSGSGIELVFLNLVADLKFSINIPISK